MKTIFNRIVYILILLLCSSLLFAQDISLNQGQFILNTAGSDFISEELFVVKHEAREINNLIALEGVNVYTYLSSGFLVGCTAQGRSKLLSTGNMVISLGERHEGYDYYVFQMDNEDMKKLSSRIEIIYHEGNEYIATIHRSLVGATSISADMLVHIPFHPLPKIDTKIPGPSYTLLTEPEIEAIVNNVSPDTFETYIQRLQDFVTRYSYHDSCRAAEHWAYDKFMDFGLETEMFEYPLAQHRWNNVIGRKIGTLFPDSIYMFVAHLDAISAVPNVLAPGAEDNASGSACVLEAARVLSEYDFECTMEFVLVTGEEQGLIGSLIYAADCLYNTRNIAGVFNFDMISYTGIYDEDIYLNYDYNRPLEVELAGFFEYIIEEYTTIEPILNPTDGPSYGSDHYWFSYLGFPAFEIIDALKDSSDWYPFWHMTLDVISALDLEFGTEVTRGAVAALATRAGLPEYTSYVINPDGSGDFPTIQDAIDNSAFRDTIILADGVFSGVGDRDLNYHGKSLVIRSQSGNPENSIIDCENYSRGVQFHSGEDNSSILRNIKIINGYADYGGGISIENSNPTIDGCVVSNCAATERGGGISCFQSAPAISGCTVEYNTSHYEGGIRVRNCSGVVIDDCIIRNNQALNSYCGGISFSGCDNCGLINCRIEDNSALHWGGGVYISNSDNITLDDCYITRNTGNKGGGVYISDSSTNIGFLGSGVYVNTATATNGGGIFCRDSELSVDSCYIGYNLAESGAGIYLEGTSSFAMEKSVVHHNDAQDDGGGIYNEELPFSVLYCTIVENQAGNNGGGIYGAENCSMGLTNTIVWDNQAGSEGDDIYISTNGFIGFTCCDVDPYKIDGPGFSIMVSNNISADPMFCPDFQREAFMIYDVSPCAPENNPECGLIGAKGVGCTMVCYEYLPGDANMPNGIWPPTVNGADVTHLVNYFRGTSDPCLLDGFYCAADVNGDCLVNGSDVTKLINYFRGLTELSWCPDYPPCWESEDDTPPEAPDGWPNCDAQSLNSSVIPRDSQRPLDYPGTIFVSGSRISPGSKELTVDVSLAIDDPIAFICIPLNYESETSVLSDIIVGDALSDWDAVYSEPNHNENSILLLAWLDLGGEINQPAKATGGNALLFQLVFKANDTNPIGDLAIMPAIDARNGGIQLGLEDGGTSFQPEIVINLSAKVDYVTNNLPGSYSLNQNYPNPFNASTIIDYGLPEPSRVIIDVFDILGRKIITLVDQDQPAGYHQAFWNSKNTPSGIYYYRLDAGNFKKTLKMLLIK
ncbi:MAG: M28 family peptidase [candidate division Zixibacteria bacterium]|nr:M28 family peptidase [candidate division Zixibacteria bacterium]